MTGGHISAASAYFLIVPWHPGTIWHTFHLKLVASDGTFIGCQGCHVVGNDFSLLVLDASSFVRLVPLRVLVLRGCSRKHGLARRVVAMSSMAVEK